MSIYKNLFPLGTHRYAASLTDIAQFMRLFEAQIAFWERRAPDAFSSIRYEELIADPEPLSRDLVAAAGLEWQDACLSFHRAKRTVKTLSSAQVRQPIYASSVGASSRHEAAMAPFWQAYGDSAQS